MKQNITTKQWDELTVSGKLKIKQVLGIVTKFLNEYRLSIGQLIEFLGDDLEGINNNPEWAREDPIYLIQWQVLVPDNENPLEPLYFEKRYLVDALWEAVKYKLNDKIN